MLWLKPFYEAVGLPKLNCVAINGDFGEPPGFFLIRAADIHPINYVVVRPHHIGAIFFHRSHHPRYLRIKGAVKACLLENGDGLTSPHAVSGIRLYFSGRAGFFGRNRTDKLDV
jgi:hypothetical protein